MARGPWWMLTRTRRQSAVFAALWGVLAVVQLAFGDRSSTAFLVLVLGPVLLAAAYAASWFAWKAQDRRRAGES